MTNHYQISQYLSILYSKYHASSKSNNWNLITNQFIDEVYNLVAEYDVFRANASKQINPNELFLRRSAIADKELKVVNGLIKDHSAFATRFTQLEKALESKYEEMFATFDSHMADQNKKNEFLAEYNAYAQLGYTNDNVRRFGESLEEYRDSCLKYRSQSQPGSN